jgi:outer membrane protein OmpA-like peptidoglycan-associated protein
LLSLLLLPVVGLEASLAFGPNPAAAEWRLEAGADRCDLEQPIPDFGAARFSYRAASGLMFELEPLRPVFSNTPVVVRAQQPQWRPASPPNSVTPSTAPTGAANMGTPDNEAPQTGTPGESGRDAAVGALGEFVIEAPNDGLWLAGSGAEELLRDIYLGADARWTQDGGAVSVTVSTVNFRGLYEPFSDCIAQLRPGSFSDLERSSVVFESGSAELDGAGRERIEAVARYVASDQRVAKLFVDGHTDSTGEQAANLLLSKRRAEMVEGLLTSLGVPRQIVVVRYHGGRYPVASNESAAGRAENRRATIRLERGAADVAKR